jgi:hypothetical protein
VRSLRTRVDPEPAPPSRAASLQPNPAAGGSAEAAIDSFIPNGLRAKLEVGGANDPEEREADRLAERALRGPSPCACDAPSCPSCAGKVRRRTDGPVGSPAPSVEGFGQGGGRPLDGGSRDRFERQFGADLSGVRIHNHDPAHQMARGIGARAFTIGSDIGFAQGRHNPGTEDGRELLAHELAHVVLGHGGVRRDGDKTATASPAPATTVEPPADFDPCAVDVPGLDNRQLLQHFRIAEGYVGKLDKAKRKGEERYYDYRNLRNRTIEERTKRAGSGHAWLHAELTDIPESLYGLTSEGFGMTMNVALVPGSEVVANKAAGGLILTKGQFDELLARENIPRIDIAEFFAQQDPNAPPKSLDIQVPVKERRPDLLDPAAYRFMQPPPDYDPYGFVHARGFWGEPARARASFSNQFLWQHAFANPMVTGGPFGFDAAQRRGFETAWRGDVGETMFRGVDPETAAAVIDLNTVQPDAPLYDYWDTRTGKFGSIKTQLPTTPGGLASLSSFQKANREVFGNSKPAKRTDALTLLQSIQPANQPPLTLEQLLRETVFNVNPETVARARTAQINAINKSPAAFIAILRVMMQDHPIAVTRKDGTSQIYNDYDTLKADYDAKLIDKGPYRQAVGTLASHASDSVQPGVGTAEGDFRPLIELRGSHDFIGAAEFAATPDTDAGKRAARERQRALYEMIASPEYLEAMRVGLKPGTVASAKMGGAMGVGSAALFDLYGTVSNWDKDPYAGRRYAANVLLSGGGGVAQGSAEYLLDQQIRRSSLAWAAARADAGKSIAPIASGSGFARFGGTTILGGAAAGAITLGGMYLDESFFGADYSTVDYGAKATRAFVSGSIAAGTGAIASGVATAYLAGGGGAAGCTVGLPVVGTVACGTVGAGVGFLVGVGAYYVAEWFGGDKVESVARDVLGEQGCKK